MSYRAARIGTAPYEEALREDRCAQGAPLVPVVKIANLGYGDDGAESQWVHGPWFPRVLGQGEVRPGFVITTRLG